MPQDEVLDYIRERLKPHGIGKGHVSDPDRNNIVHVLWLRPDSRRMYALHLVPAYCVKAIGGDWKRQIAAEIRRQMNVEVA